MWAIYPAPHISLSLLCLIKLESNTNNKMKGNCEAAIWTALRRFHFRLSSIPPSAAFNYAKRKSNLKQTSGGNTAFCVTPAHTFINAEGVWARTAPVYNRSINTTVEKMNHCRKECTQVSEVNKGVKRM